MALKIKANSMFMARSLQLDSHGVTFVETAAIGGKRQFAFREIDYILMSPDHVLSFQVGKEVFSIPTKPAKKSHQELINALLQCVRKSTQALP